MILSVFSSHTPLIRSNWHWQRQCQCKRSRSQVKVTEVKTNFAPIWTCPCRNSSLNSHMATKWCTKKWHRKCALLIFKVICEISRSRKANLRDLIAATGLVICLKFYLNHRFFGLCDLEIWCMTLKNNGASLLYNIKLCASFQSHWWIQTELLSRNAQIRVKMVIFFLCDL